MYLTLETVGNIGDGWFAATENSDYIQAIGLSSAKFAKFQHSLSILKPIAPQVYPLSHLKYTLIVVSSRSSLSFLTRNLLKTFHRSLVSGGKSTRFITPSGHVA